MTAALASPARGGFSHSTRICLPHSGQVCPTANPERSYRQWKHSGGRRWWGVDSRGTRDSVPKIARMLGQAFTLTTRTWQNCRCPIGPAW